MKLEDAILSVFSTYPSPMDASDALLALEDKTGKEYRFALIFDCIQRIAESGALVVARKEGKRTLYQLPPMTPLSTPAAQGTVRRVRHKKRGSTYEVLHGALMQSTHWHDTYYKVPADGRSVVVYRSESDGSVWVRPASEFEDGRFEDISASPSPVALPTSGVVLSTLVRLDIERILAEDMRTGTSRIVQQLVELFERHAALTSAPAPEDRT